MSFNWLEIIENLIPPLKEKRQAEELALQNQKIVRQLSGLPSSDSDEGNIITVLESTFVLLKRFQENPELLNPKLTPISQPNEVNQLEEVHLLPSPPIVREMPQEKPSARAQELIRLRDWVLLAKSGEGEAKTSPKVLDTLYEKIGQILEKEGITSLEETGHFNYERQQVVSTQATDDPEKKDLICDIVRPGYLFKGILVRPQEVIVYSFINSGYQANL